MGFINTDYRRAKTQGDAFEEVGDIARGMSEISDKIEVWKRFIIDSKKRLSASGEEDEFHLRMAKRKIEELRGLKKEPDSNFNSGSFFNFSFSSERRFRKRLSFFNLEIKYVFKGLSLDGEFPLKAVDVDYNNVTFNLLLTTCCNFSERVRTEIRLRAYNRSGTFLGESEEFISPLKHPSKIEKRVYVPSMAKDAHKFLITISFAKNVGSL